MTRLRHLLSGVGLVAAGPAAACSMMAGYKVPTNLELAAQADTIVIASVETVRAGEDKWRGTIVAKPSTLLKGAVLPETVELAGAAIVDSETAGMVVASAARELRAPNPGALIGGCVRYVFAKGMKLVLFLERDKAGQLVPYRSSFSRDAEDVADENALWVKAVREYAAISLAPRRQWKALLRERIVSLRALTANPDAHAIADDMAVELSGKRRPSYD